MFAELLAQSNGHLLYIDVLASVGISLIVWMVTKVAKIPVILEGMQKWQEDHESSDNRRFAETREDHKELVQFVHQSMKSK